MYFHVWFGTRGRRWLLLSEVEESVKEALWEISRDNGIRLLECESMVEHMHLLLEIEPEALPRAMNKLKGISSRRLFQQFPEFKLDARTSHFWQKRYGAKAVAPDALGSVRRYIKTQRERPEKYEDRGQT